MQGEDEVTEDRNVFCPGSQEQTVPCNQQICRKFYMRWLETRGVNTSNSFSFRILSHPKVTCTCQPSSDDFLSHLKDPHVVTMLL